MASRLEVDCRSNVQEELTFPSPDGRTGHVTKFQTYSPRQMIACTQQATESDLYMTTSSEGDMSIVFSRDMSQKGAYSEDLMLSVSGGKKVEQKRIVRNFGRLLGIVQEEYGWLSVGPLDIRKRDMYVWTIKLA